MTKPKKKIKEENKKAIICTVFQYFQTIDNVSGCGVCCVCAPSVYSYLTKTVPKYKHLEWTPQRGTNIKAKTSIPKRKFEKKIEKKGLNENSHALVVLHEHFDAAAYIVGGNYDLTTPPMNRIWLNNLNRLSFYYGVACYVNGCK